VLKDDLLKGLVPQAWRKYSFPDTLSASAWVADFVERTGQYKQISAHALAGKSLSAVKLWIGGVMEPGAFFTASRQAVAQAKNVPLEQLRMELSVQPSGYAIKPQEVALIGCRYEGVRVEENVVSIVEELYRTEECTVLRWVTGEPGYSAAEQVMLPIYLNCVREGLLIDTISFKAAAGSGQGVFYERGAAVICSALGGAV
jgi:uncharacterized protein YjeT (DUF2065 family)